jgi:hypothetical protein
MWGARNPGDGVMAQQLPEPRRKEIFLALVDAQDQEMPVEVSRKVVAERFGVSEEQVRQIEREGLDNDWPPLEGPAAE